MNDGVLGRPRFVSSLVRGRKWHPPEWPPGALREALEAATRRKAEAEGELVAVPAVTLPHRAARGDRVGSAWVRTQ